MTERFQPISIEGFFSYSNDSEGAYVSAGPSGKIHVQHRLNDECRILFVSLPEDEIGLDILWQSEGISCYLSKNLIMGDKKIVVECSNADYFEIFNRLIAEIVSDCILSGLEIINLFRFEKIFWSTIPNPMTEEQAVGLFGELYLMTEWFSDSIIEIIENGYWTGPNRASKDYNFSNFQIEVKTSMSITSPRKHKISSLNQLQTDGAPLMLYSLVAIPELNGEFSLCDLVETIREKLSSRSNGIKIYFLKLLEKNNFKLGHPEMENYRYSLPLGNGKFYSISGHFPRLIPEQDADDDRIHIEDYSIALIGVENLELNLNSPINSISILDEYSRVFEANN